jgi:hypothetical protein
MLILPNLIAQEPPSFLFLIDNMILKCVCWSGYFPEWERALEECEHVPQFNPQHHRKHKNKQTKKLKEIKRSRIPK